LFEARCNGRFDDLAGGQSESRLQRFAEFLMRTCGRFMTTSKAVADALRPIFQLSPMRCAYAAMSWLPAPSASITCEAARLFESGHPISSADFCAGRSGVPVCWVHHMRCQWRTGYRHLAQAARLAMGNQNASNAPAKETNAHGESFHLFC
jgi:hypothetical protein